MDARPGSDLLLQMRDRWGIAEVLHAYCRLVDENRPADAAALFAETGVFDYGLGRVYRGRSSVEELLDAGLARYRATSHHLSNVEISFSDTATAHARSALYAWHRGIDGKEMHLWGRYIDTLVRADGDAWLLQSRSLRATGVRYEPPSDVSGAPYEFIPRNPV